MTQSKKADQQIKDGKIVSKSMKKLEAWHLDKIHFAEDAWDEYLYCQTWDKNIEEDKFFAEGSSGGSFWWRRKA